MSPETKDQFPLFVLTVLLGGGTIGMSEEYFLQQVRSRFDHNVTLSELQALLLEMAGKEWAICVPAIVGRPRWRITALGMSVAQEVRL